jgi:serine-type D-Ala-D-Ala endopeptidase (penicillin-binding protein 7)
MMIRLNRASRRTKITLCASLLYSALGTSASHATVLENEPSLKSSAVLVLDEADAKVLLSRHADEAAPIASITKLMTALVVLDAGQDLNEVIEITRDDANLERTNVSRLAVGSKLTRGDLLHMALMSSENRAAHALGRNYPGGLAEAVKAMNAKAAKLGMTRSHFVEPTGLSSDNVATPADLSKLVIAASHNETIRRYSTDGSHIFTIGKRKLEFRTTDHLVSNSTWDILLQKTGYIEEAGRCLVMKARIAGRNVVIVLLNSYGKYTRTADATRIKRWMEANIHPANIKTASISPL